MPLMLLSSTSQRTVVAVEYQVCPEVAFTRDKFISDRSER